MTVLSSLFKYFAFFGLGLTILAACLLLFLLSGEPLTSSSEHLSPTEVNAANQKLQSIRDKFVSRQTEIKISLTQQDVDSVLAVASHVLPNIQFGAAVTPYGMMAAATMTVSIAKSDYYLNASCMLYADNEQSGIKDCQIGQLPISANLVSQVVIKGLGFQISSDTQQMVQGLIANARYSGRRLILEAEKPADLKEQINNSIRGVVSRGQTTQWQGSADIETINVYIRSLRLMDNSPKSLAYYVGTVMKMAADRTALGAEPIRENTAALWALAIKFGSNRFSTLIGYDTKPNVGKRRSATLAERHDLALHFLYSAILHQLGRAKFALRVGEAKELLDTSKGGSGYSFADLAADKAGIKFSELLTANRASAMRAQRLLREAHQEQLFFPTITDLPEGLSEQEFMEQYGDIDSASYNLLSRKIDERINTLPLYH